MKFLQEKWQRGFSDKFIIFWLFAAVWILRLAVIDVYPIPMYKVQDELANLLGAKTFIEGRLTNPPVAKELQDSLVEIHILPEPTRMMKYQPAMAGFMAIGIKIFGDAYCGVVLLMSFAIAASYWFMRGWANKTVSLIFSLYMLLLFRAPHYFIDGYFGGGHVLLGTFLVLGAYPRIFYKRDFSSIWWGMIGVVFLMLSRPYEGGVFVFSVAFAGGFYLLKKFSKSEKILFIKKSIMPVLLIGGALLAFQFNYNKTITGNYFKLPYQEYSEQRDYAPNFWMLGVNENANSEHYVLKSVNEGEMEGVKNRKKELISEFPQSVSNLFGISRLKKFSNFGVENSNYQDTLRVFCALFYLCLAYLVPIFLLLHNFIKGRYVGIASIFALQTVAIFMIKWHSFLHYFAIWFVLYWLIIILSIIDFDRRRYFSEKTHKVMLVVFFVFMLIPVNQYGEMYIGKIYSNKEIINHINSMAGEHIVFVNGREENDSKVSTAHLLVYNEPDIANSKVIWAWDISPEQNKKLIDAYPNRKIWYIEPSTENKLVPYYDKY